MVARFAEAVIPLGEIALVKRIRNARRFVFIPPRKRPIPRRSSDWHPVFFYSSRSPLVADEDGINFTRK